MRQFVSKLKHCLCLSLLLAALVLPTVAVAADYSCTANIPVRVHVYDETETAFTVQLEAEDSAPLPDQCTLTIVGSGEGEFGPITYTKPGDYHYTVRQATGDAQYVTYDDAVYTVTVRVTNTADNGLAAEIWAVHDGETEKAAQVSFENRYTPPKPTTPNAPKTGDGAPLEQVVGIAALAAVTLVGLVVWTGKRSRS